MDAHDMSFTLDTFARKSGLYIRQPFYITGEFRCNPGWGDTLYSDSSMLYCEECADMLLTLAFPFLSQDAEYYVESCSGAEEDTPSACEVCGCVLEYMLTGAGVSYEMDHYRENPPQAPLSPDDAFAIASVLAAAAYDPEVIALGEAAVALIHTAKEGT